MTVPQVGDTQGSGHVAGAVLASLAAIGAYINTLPCGFAFDDNFAVLSNGDVSDPTKPLSALWNNDFWGQDITSEGSHKSWRPLAVLFMRACRVLGSGDGPPTARSFHAANVALHALVSALVYGVAVRLCTAWDAPAPRLRATLTALLFALHPAHTEAVSGVVGVAELLSALFCLLGFLLYTAGCPLREPSAVGFVCSGACTLLALLCTAAAVLSKETGITVCGAFVLWECLRFCVPGQHTSTPDASPQKRHRKARGTAARLACTMLFAAAYLSTRRHVIGGDTLVKIFRRVENPIAFLPTSTARLLTTGHSHVRYAILLLWPHNLCCDWSHACMLPVEGFNDARAATIVALYLLLTSPVLHALRALYRHHRCNAPTPPTRALIRAFAVLAFGAAPFAPAANLVFYVGTFIGERLLYMPSLAFCLVLGDALADLISASGRHNVNRICGWALTLCILAAYGLRTIARNRDWVSEEALFESALTVCPDSAKVLLNTGILARREQDWPLALHRFRRAMEVEPVQYCEPLYWIGLTLVNSGAVMQGQDYLSQSLDCKWVAVEAAKALHAVLHARLEANAKDVDAMMQLGSLLGRTTAKMEACTMYLRAAAAFEAAGMQSNATEAQARCAELQPDMAHQSLVECARAVETALERVASKAGKKNAVETAQRAFMTEYGIPCTGSEDYLRLVHSWQSADAYDVELHLEWARLLEARGGRDKEVQAHRHAAMMLRQHEIQQKKKQRLGPPRERDVLAEL